MFLDEVTGCPLFVSGSDKCSQQAFVCFAQSVATRFCFAHVISSLFFLLMLSGAVFLLRIFPS
ncbi:hypothetical protein BFD14_25965 [Escherichia coli]|nr:hypothetical protein BFD14_25965 [Escherichia coli]